MSLATPDGSVASLPRVDLVNEPTPLHELPRFADFLRAEAASAGNRGPATVLMKREDLMPFGLGGNKLRSLEYVVGDALAQGATDLLAGGRPQANHCRLVAATAARCGLSAHVILAGPPQRPRGANEAMMNLLGAQVTHATGSSAEERTEIMSRTAERLLGEGRRPYLVDAPLRGVPGSLGPMRAGLETAGQLAANGVIPSHIFVAVATGTTLAGLQAGFWRAGLRPRVVGVPTHLAGAPSGEAVADHVRTVVADLVALPVSDPAPAIDPPSDVELDSMSAWGEYAASSPGATKAQVILARAEGICVDPVYTARTIASVIGWSRIGRLSSATVVIWNGGGMPALFESPRGPDRRSEPVVPAVDLRGEEAHPGRAESGRQQRGKFALG